MSFPNCDAGHWAFTAVLDLDRFTPGLLGEVLRGSPTRRQVICATLSVHHTTRLSDQQKSDLARELRFAKGKVLIADTFGSTPEGFISCLAKMRASYETRAFYVGLYRLYINPLATEAVRYLNGCRGFNEEAPSATPSGVVRLATLGSVFLKRELISRLGFPWCARDVEHVVRFLRRAVPKLTDDEIAGALAGADRLEPIEPVIKRCLGSRASPALALSTHPAFEVLSTSEQLEQTGRDFHNCLGGSGYGRLLRSKQNMLLVWRGEEPAVLRLTKRFRFWSLHELKAPKNRAVSAATAQKIAAILEPLGVFCPVCDLDGLT
jgi:hypothetical protein